MFQAGGVARQLGRRVGEKLSNVWRYCQREGWRRTLLQVAEQSGLTKLDPRSSRQLNRILAEEPRRPIVVLHHQTVEWHMPLHQRPQHLARQLARHGMLYFFGTRNRRYDFVQGFQAIEPGCYLTNQVERVEARPERLVVHLYSTDNQTAWSFVSEHLRRGHHVLYEYVDEIHPDISRKQIPSLTWDRHRRILADERCLVVATADKLYRDVAGMRGRNFRLVTNGVDLDHFRFHPNQPPPARLAGLLADGRPILGYYGALASWFDYALIRALARKRPDWQIVLIGPDYDGSLARADLTDLSNVFVLGALPYRELPAYARHFSVACIPFVINAITQSTSPLKLFEYMALGLPILTTDLDECRKYRSVTIARTADEFAARLDGLHRQRHDPVCQAGLRAEAEANSWAEKARSLVELIRENEEAGG